MSSFEHARGFVPDAGNRHPAWTVSDIALLDELAAIIGPPPEQPEADPTLFLDEGADVAEVVTLADRLTTRHEVDPDDEGVTTFSHVLVDESQDITPMQWRMLRRRGPQASWTLVGDPAQSSYPNTDESRRALRDLIGKGQSRAFRLSTNYRSPAEVMDLAGQVIHSILPDADLPEAVRRTGVAPRLLSGRQDRLGEQLGRIVRQLSDEVEGSIAVVTPPSRADAVRALVGAMPLPVGVPSRLIVVTALQAKGLEFDAVIVVAPDEIIAETPGGVRVLYVALTRPTQRLVTLDLTDGLPGAWQESLESPLSDSA